MHEVDGDTRLLRHSACEVSRVAHGELDRHTASGAGDGNRAQTASPVHRRPVTRVHVLDDAELLELTERPVDHRLLLVGLLRDVLGSDVRPKDNERFAEMFADNPLGQGSQQTPMAIVFVQD